MRVPRVARLGQREALRNAYGNGAACTTCHLAGDRYDNYKKRGHGKTTPDSLSTYQHAGVRLILALPCTACHFAMDVTTSEQRRHPQAARREEPSPAVCIREDLPEEVQ